MDIGSILSKLTLIWYILSKSVSMISMNPSNFTWEESRATICPKLTMHSIHFRCTRSINTFYEEHNQHSRLSLVLGIGYSRNYDAVYTCTQSNGRKSRLNYQARLYQRCLQRLAPAKHLYPPAYISRTRFYSPSTHRGV